MKTIRRALAFALMGYLTVGCAVTGDLVGGRASAPMNPGPRLDMVIADPGHRSATLLPTVQATWSGSASLSSWFVLVDRVVDPTATVALELDFRGVSRESQRVGTPKYGYTTLYSSRAEVVFTLVDIRSGVIMASAAGRGVATGTRLAGLDDNAVRQSVETGLHRLIEIYAGGAS